jgi:hypothetical protein
MMNSYIFKVFSNGVEIMQITGEGNSAVQAFEYAYTQNCFILSLHETYQVIALCQSGLSFKFDVFLDF